MSFLRVFRIVRLVRVARVLRTLRLISEFRNLVTCMMSSFRSFVWSVAFVFMLIYICSIIVMRIISEHRLHSNEDTSKEIDYFYGTLGRTMLTMFECVASGLSWDEA